MPWMETETLTVSLGEEVENLSLKRQLLDGIHNHLHYLIISTRRRTN